MHPSAPTSAAIDTDPGGKSHGECESGGLGKGCSRLHGDVMDASGHPCADQYAKGHDFDQDRRNVGAAGEATAACPRTKAVPSTG